MDANTFVTEKRKKIRKRLGKDGYPTKDKINFAQIGVTPMKMEIMVPGIILILIFAFLISKFFVVDRLVAFNQLSSEVNSLQVRLDEANATIDSYSEVEEKYAHYTYSDMTPEELALQNRMEVVELINKYILNRAQVGSWTITGNEVNIPITGVTFHEIGEIVAEIEGDDMVDHCEVIAASTNDDGVIYNSLTSDITALQGTAGATGQVTIYLKDATSDASESEVE